MNRREFLKWMGSSLLGVALLPQLQKTYALPGKQTPCWVNDMHTQLSRTKVQSITPLKSKAESISFIKAFQHSQTGIAIAGARHSAGGQQFLTNGQLLDIRQLNNILGYDRVQQTIDVESGCTWTQVMDYLHQQGSPLSIRQKPTGNDEITIGGSLSTNIHGRGLNFPPIISDIEAIQLINAKGELIRCSRTQNAELFSLAIGGYGLFGFIYSASIRLYSRQKVQRQVTALPVSGIVEYYQQVIASGCTYGDYEFCMDERSEAFMQDGFFVTYQPVSDDTPTSADIPDTELAAYNLSYLVHINKAKAYEIYKEHHFKTAGQVYWSDNQQLGSYVNDYHRYIDQQLHAQVHATEVIMEVFVPLDSLTTLFKRMKADFIKHRVNLIYGTVRFIGKDTDSFMPWAKGDFACVIFNIHTPHTTSEIQKTDSAMQRLIQCVCECQGTYYLTYGNHAHTYQTQHCYPEMQAFLNKKLLYDPDGVFQSNWYHHQKQAVNLSPSTQ